MADKRGLHEKADAESKGFPSPGTDEFRKQINESLKLYSESLDKLIGSNYHSDYDQRNRTVVRLFGVNDFLY